jgi:hypothetical protein
MPIVEDASSPALQFAPEARHHVVSATESRRGRPLLISREQVLEQIRQLAGRSDGLFRVHRQHPDLYARARRLFGAWSRAVALAGLDYRVAIEAARQRSLRNRRTRAKRIADRAS